MSVKIQNMIRGDGLCYVLLKISDERLYLDNTLSDNLSDLFALNISGDGDKYINGRVIEFNDDDDSENSSIYLVLVFPLITESVTLELFKKSPKGGKEKIWTKRINPETLKWRSRLNYRLNRDSAMKIRDIEKTGSLNCCDIEITDIIPDDDCDVVRGFIQTSQENIVLSNLKVVDKLFTEIPISAIPMGTLYSVSPTNCRITINRLNFSMRMPNGSLDKIITYTENGDQPETLFISIDDSLRNQKIGDYISQYQAGQFQTDYNLWLREHSSDYRELELQRLSKFNYEPKISIITPIFNTRIDHLEDMLDSVAKQTYSNWEHVLVNASPENHAICEMLKDYAEKDKRIKIISLSSNLGITKNTAKGIRGSDGEFVAFLDHDDLLMSDALYEYVKAINEDPSIDLVYCDEDKTNEGDRSSPYFKPDFSLFLLREVNYVCHFLLIRKSLLEQIDYDDSVYDGAQDHNMVLQCVEKTKNIKHIPKVLYSWRITEGSTASGTDAKPYADTAGRLAIEKHLERSGIKGVVEGTCDNCRYHVRYEVINNPKVSIIIPNKDNSEILKNCIESILAKSTYDNYEIIIVENNSVDNATFEIYDELKGGDHRVQVIKWDGPFNFSEINNYGVKHSNGEYVLFLNNDTEVITPEWLEIMLGICQQPEVGAVGVKLLYPDMLIQHAGVYVQENEPGHINLNLPRHERGYFNTVRTTRELSAVTAACIMVKRDVFIEIEGFDSRYAVAYNDVDICMKIRDAGYSVVYTPMVELFHYESISRGYEKSHEKKLRANRELTLLKYKWSDQFIEGDPYLNPNLNPNSPFLK